jgi:hypothetical protein
MRRSVLTVCALSALVLGAGLVSASSVEGKEPSPFRLLGPASAATTNGSSPALDVTPVRWGWGGGYYRPYYGGYNSYYRGGYGSYYRGGYGSYYRGYGYGYRPYYNSYRPYYGGYGGYGGYYGYRPGLNLYFGF